MQKSSSTELSELSYLDARAHSEFANLPSNSVNIYGRLEVRYEWQENEFRVEELLYKPRAKLDSFSSRVDARIKFSTRARASSVIRTQSSSAAESQTKTEPRS